MINKGTLKKRGYIGAQHLRGCHKHTISRGVISPVIVEVLSGLYLRLRTQPVGYVHLIRKFLEHNNVITVNQLYWPVLFFIAWLQPVFNSEVACSSVLKLELAWHFYVSKRDHSSLLWHYDLITLEVLVYKYIIHILYICIWYYIHVYNGTGLGKNYEPLGTGHTIRSHSSHWPLRLEHHSTIHKFFNLII